MRAFLLLSLFGIVYCCTHNGKTYKNGEKWIVNERFLMECVEYGTGSWKTEMVGCVLKDGTEIAINSSKIVGNDEWRCTADSQGFISLKQHINANAKCGNRTVGTVWREESFEFQCAPGGQQKLHSCFTKTGQKIPANSEKLVGNYLMKCYHFENGTVSLTGSLMLSDRKPNVEIKCVDAKGVRHKVGSYWLEIDRFNKTCKPSGRIEVVNCVAKNGLKIPVDGELIQNGIKYACEKTVDGAVHFSMESAP